MTIHKNIVSCDQILMSYFSEFMIKCEAEDGGGGHLQHQDDHHHDEVLVQAPLQGGELVLGDL